MVKLPNISIPNFNTHKKTITQLLLLSAPRDKLEEWVLSEATKKDFWNTLKEPHAFYYFYGRAIYYSCQSSLRLKRRYMDVVANIKSIPPLALYELISFAKSEAYWEANDIKDEIVKVDKSKAARKKANAKHGKLGSDHLKAEKARKEIRATWAKGNFISRSACAEQECGALGVSYNTAYKALLNQPNPNPWHAKTAKQASSKLPPKKRT